MKIKITKPNSILFEGDAKLLQLPGAGGKFEILENHAPIISTLTKGDVEYAGNVLPILGGFVEVQKNQVSLCVELKEE